MYFFILYLCCITAYSFKIKMSSEDNKLFNNKLSESKHLYDINSTFIHNRKNISGNDERFENEKNEIDKIYKIHNTMKLIMLLQSVSLHEKLNIINSYEDSYTILKIKSGGLMTDCEVEEF